MGSWKSRVLTIIFMFGVLGGLIAEQIIDISFLSDPAWATFEYGIFSGLIGLAVCTFIAVLCAVGILVYVCKWWIITAIIILQIAIYASRRN